MSEHEPPQHTPTNTASESSDLPASDERFTSDPYEGALPPGYDWPTHGGYLGCLLGLMASCIIGGFLGSTLFATLRVLNILPGIVTALLTLVAYVLFIALLGRLGWTLGKRFYREYPKPRGKSWGEDDDYEHPTVLAASEEAAETHPSENADPHSAPSTAPIPTNAPNASEE